MKKVLIITYYWPPAGGAGVQRWLNFANYLPVFGWEPIVLTVDSDYASYPQTDTSLFEEISEKVRVVYTKSFEPLQWYGKIAGKERIPYGGFSNKKANSTLSKFIRGNFFIPDARRGWNRYARLKALEIIENESIDCIITTGPPHSTHLIGLYLKKKFNIAWVADFRDPWSDIYYNYDMPRTAFAKSYDRRLEREVLQAADRCLTASPGFAQLFSEKVKRKYEVITNGFDALLKPAEKPSDTGVFTIVYTGTIASSYTPETLFSVLAQLPAGSFRLRIAGNIAETVSAQIVEYGLADVVDYLGYVSHGQSMELLTTADLLLLLNPVVKNSQAIIPGKLFEYLSAGIPIMALAGKEGSISEILEKTGTGKSFEPNDEEGILNYLLQMQGGAKFHPNMDEIMKYNRRNLSERLVALLEELIE